MKKKTLALILSAVMLAGALTGCGNSDAVSNNPAEDSSAVLDTPSTESVATEEDADPVAISYLGYYTSSIPMTADTWAEQLLEETFNLDITAVTDVTSENIDTVIASGEILDVTCFPTYLYSDMTYLYEQELIREIPEEWLWEYYPTGMEIYTEFLGEEFFEEGRHLKDGKLLCIPRITVYNGAMKTVYFRQDWLDNLGLSEPTTLDELHDMLYAFTYDDPDGNGADDTYGISCILGDQGIWPIMGAFGLYKPSLYYQQEDGSVVLCGATDEYKQALEIFSEWYAEGIIDPECVTDDRSAMRGKWAAGQLGALCDTIGWGTSDRGAAGVVGMVESVFGEGTVSHTGAMTSQYGDGTIYSSINYPSVFLNQAMMFSAEATDEQVIAVLKMFEGICKDDELAIKILYGEEGVDYHYDENGVLVMEDTVTIEYQSSKGLVTYGNQAWTDTIVNLTRTERDVAMYEKGEAQKYVYAQNNFPTVDCEAYNTYGSEVAKLVEEYFYNALMGKANLEGDWDAYIANLKAAGLDKITAEYEELLK